MRKIDVQTLSQLSKKVGSKSYLNAATWITAGAIGVLAVLYAKLIAYFQELFFSAFRAHPILVCCTGPFLFIVATWLVRKFGPDAKGSGIPQVLCAIEAAHEHKADEQRTWLSSLVSVRTAVVKVISSSVGILAGASIGREGPTIQIAAAGFAWSGRWLKKYSPKIEFQTVLVAGSAAGVAAAFNTPLAGITFAIEELGTGVLGTVRELVMVAIIVSGVIAQGLAGDYLYFGHAPLVPVSFNLVLLETLLIGLVGGLFGGLFAKTLTTPTFTRLPQHWLSRAFVTGAICAAIAYFTDAATSGSGYEVASRLLKDGKIEDFNIAYPLLKLVTTSLSYLSGMAGGIFSPSLSMGAGFGLAIAKLAGFVNFKSCALFGMVAFFAGAVQAPLTAVVIVMEMTNEHSLILPFMIAAYLASACGRRLMPEPLYHHLARRHQEG